MPDVIVNTSPLQYLHQIGQLSLLPALYGKVHVPEAVSTELTHGRTLGHDLPDVVALPWAIVCPQPDSARVPFMPGLGPGETEVLVLAIDRMNVLVILDDALARRHAKRLRIRYTGTVGLVIEAKQRGILTAVAPVLDALQARGFWLDASTREAALQRAGERS